MDQPELNPAAQACLQALLQEWFDFERQLGRVAILQRLQAQRFGVEDYRRLLLNMRQQVIEGSRWITRCASSFDRQYADIRATIIGHAGDECRDYEMLERDFVAAGGGLEQIRGAERNAGTEALHAFLMYRASQPNPYDLLGAMWIIEGLGQKMAAEWASSIAKATRLPAQAQSFMRYHADNDDAHLEKLYQLLERLCQSAEHSAAITRTARVTAKLYIMQLEEIDHAQAT